MVSPELHVVDKYHFLQRLVNQQSIEHHIACQHAAIVYQEFVIHTRPWGKPLSDRNIHLSSDQPVSNSSSDR